MTTSASPAEQRAATRKALARKAAARKQPATKPLPSTSQADDGTGSERPASSARPGRSSANQSSANQSSVAQSSANRSSANRSSVAKSSANRSSAGRSVAKSSAGSTLVGKARTGTTAVTAAMERTKSRKAEMARGPIDTSYAVETIQVGSGQVGSVEVGSGRGRSRRKLNRDPQPGRRTSVVVPKLRALDTTPARRTERGAGSVQREGDQVAPFVPPTGRWGRFRVRRRWERRGFIPVSPGRTKLRHRILPRTVIGISFMLLAFGIGVGFSGAAFYAYYEKRLAENEETVARFVDGFDRQFTDAVGAMDDLRVQAVGDIRQELVPLGDYVTDANGVVNLPVSAGPSVWQLDTRDEAGQVVSGAAFAVASHGEGTAFVTSYSLVAASTTSPSPAIELVKRSQRLTAQLWAWDVDRDLAIVVVEEVIPPLALASDRDQVSTVGSRLFALSGVGGQGSTASPGVLLDHSQSGLQHTVPVGTLFQGGPLLNGDGKVIGMASLHYQPYGIDQGQVLQAPDVASLCARVLSCTAGNDQLSIDLAAKESEGTPAQTPTEPATGEPAIGELPTGPPAGGD